MSRIKIRKNKRVKPIHDDQWIEIYTENGQTVTEFYPPNEELEKIRQDREIDRPDDHGRPVYMYRRFFFRGPVPIEYQWIVPDAQFAQYGGLYMERMSLPDWHELIERERDAANGLAQHCRTPLRRPEAYGPCPCPKCQANPDRLPDYPN